jgi:hypothetical protein
MTSQPDAHPALIERLARSRQALLAALAERTESDFHRALRGDYGDESLVHALARLALEERGDSSELPDHPLPPQAMHHLAGARYATLNHIATIDDSDAAEAFVASIVDREQALTDHLINHASPRTAKDEQGVAKNH